MNRKDALQRGEGMRARAMESVRRTAAPIGAALAVIVAAGCGGDGPRSTGGTAPAPQAGTLTPRPSRSSHDLNGAPQCTGTDVHQKHLSKFSCDTCHSSGGAYGFTNPNVFPRGTTTAGGVLVLKTDTTPTTCTVACHYPMGGTAKSITWNTPGPLACTDCHSATNLPSTHPVISPTADCRACHQTTTHLTGTVTLVGHDTAWMTQTSPGFHAFSAVQGLAPCQQCHGQDLGGGSVNVSCGSCHDQNLPTGIASWRINCVMCHGGVDNQTGAPPAAIWGQAGDPNRGAGVADPVRVGAHTAHVAGSALAPPFDCGVCHVKPADVFADGHIDTVTSGNVPLATMTFSGMAIQGLGQGMVAAWNRTTATCANTYCHGATVGGGTLKSPVWTTVDGSQAACGTCHGVPPPSPHPTVDVTAGLKVCNPCHTATIDATGAVIPPSAGGKHLDGLVEATGHQASWMDTTSAGFHAYSADSNIAACQGCHGANLDGVGGIATTACAQCHDSGLPTGVASWKTNCVMCHGGTENQSGAPPKAIWGYAGDPSRGGGTADPVRVGAHSAHVAGVSSSGITLSAPFDCGVCHVKPTDALSAGHVDGTTATVTFSGLGAQGASANSSPTWTRATATCAGTYCHGATLHGGASTTPVWTGGSPQAACGTCHGVPPPASIGHVQNTNCGNCHPGYTLTSVNPATHVNGTIELVGLTCTTCHGDPQRAATTLNPQLAAAPPLDTWGNSGTTSPGVGAHQAHLTDGQLRGALACIECHAVPTSIVTHPNGTLDLTWGTLATTGGAVPAYSGGTCSTTYCHGATLNAGGTNQAPRWTGGSAEAACGTCHGVPPPSPPHPTVIGGLSACSACHSATMDATGAIISTSAGGKHIDGIVQATSGHDASWMDTSSAGFHAYSANQGLETCENCHGANLDGVGGITTVACGQCHDTALPVGVTSWKTNCVMCHGGTDNQTGAPPKARWGSTDPIAIGAHTSHVAATHAVSLPLDCVSCHVKPADALAAGHVDGAVTVTGYTGTNAALLATVKDPGWNRTAGTCATAYCHGATLQGGTLSTPTWITLDGTQAACGTCHGMPPPTGRLSQIHNQGDWYPLHVLHVLFGYACGSCHPGYPADNGSTNKTIHVDGAVEVGNNISSWDPVAGSCLTRCHGTVMQWR